MLRQLSVQIPKSEWPRISEFLNISIEELQKIVDFVSRAMPLPDVEDLAEQCEQETGVAALKADAVFSVAVNLSSIQRSLNKPASDILQIVAEALARTGFPNWQDTQLLAWTDRQSLLAQLLVTDSTIEIMSKARELLYDFQCIFVNSAVLTDVRHIYDKSATEIKAGLVSFTLGLEFMEGRDLRQIHVSLSTAEVEKLISQLQRAQSKGETATAMLKKNLIPELTPKRDL